MIGTIYLGWHYVVDNIAGVILGTIALILAGLISGIDPRAYRAERSRGPGAGGGFVRGAGRAGHAVGAPRTRPAVSGGRMSGRTQPRARPHRRDAASAAVGGERGELDELVAGDEAGARRRARSRSGCRGRGRCRRARVTRAPSDASRGTPSPPRATAAGGVGVAGLERVERVALHERAVERGEDVGAADVVEHGQAAADRDERAGLAVVQPAIARRELARGGRGGARRCRASRRSASATSMRGSTSRRPPPRPRPGRRAPPCRPRRRACAARFFMRAQRRVGGLRRRA